MNAGTKVNHTTKNGAGYLQLRYRRLIYVHCLASNLSQQRAFAVSYFIQWRLELPLLAITLGSIVIYSLGGVASRN